MMDFEHYGRMEKATIAFEIEGSTAGMDVGELPGMLWLFDAIASPAVVRHLHSLDKKKMRACGGFLIVDDVYMRAMRKIIKRQRARK